MRRILVSVPLLLAAVATLSGCVAAPLAMGAAGGVATFQYLENQQVEEYDCTLGQAFDATLCALREQGYPPPALALPETTEAQVKSGAVSVAMACFTEGRVRVAVRVGAFKTGDHKRRAALLHEAIARRVAAPEDVPEPAEAPAST